MHSHNIDRTLDSSGTPHVHSCTTSHNVVWHCCDMCHLILFLLQQAHTNILGGADSLVGANNLAAWQTWTTTAHDTSCGHMTLTWQWSTPPYPTITAIIMPMTSHSLATTNQYRNLGREIPPTSHNAQMPCQPATWPTSNLVWHHHVYTLCSMWVLHRLFKGDAPPMHPMECKYMLLHLWGCVGISG